MLDYCLNFVVVVEPVPISFSICASLLSSVGVLVDTASFCGNGHCIELNVKLCLMSGGYLVSCLIIVNFVVVGTEVEFVLLFSLGVSSNALSTLFLS